MDATVTAGTAARSLDGRGLAVSAAGGVDDRLLVRRAQGGDLAAFEALYRANVGRVHAVCRRLAGHAALAEELTQEAFVRAWRRLATFRGESSFATWLHRVAVNAFLDHCRGRDVRRESAGEDGDAALAAMSTAHDPGAGIDLERAISLLPSGARTVFVLHDVEGFEHGEISAMTGIAVGTSKAQLHRARRLLREVLQP